MVTDRFFDVSDEFPYKSAFIATNILGFIIEVITVLHVGIVLKLFAPITLIHKHFKIISYNMWICILLRSLFNASFYISNVFHLAPLLGIPKFLYDFIRDVFNMGVYLLPLSNVCERLFATIYATIYENYFSPTLVIVLCVIPWLLSAFLSVHLFFIRYYFDVTYVYMVYELAATGVYIAYFVLCYQERKKQKNSIGVLTLTERYQRTENQKCIQTILRFALSSVISLILTVVYSIVVLYVLPKYYLNLSLDDKIAYFRQLINICVSIVTFTLPIHFAYINPGLLRKYKSVLRRIFCPLKPALSSRDTSTISVSHIVSVTGKNLVPHDETRFHFNALDKVWNS